jgi:serine O-acetyltransferase
VLGAFTVGEYARSAECGGGQPVPAGATAVGNAHIVRKDIDARSALPVLGLRRSPTATIRCRALHGLINRRPPDAQIERMMATMKEAGLCCPAMTEVINWTLSS